MLKTRGKKLIGKILTSGIISMLSLSLVNASGIFPSSNYYLPQGKDMLLSPFRHTDTQIKWESSNPEVASVDVYGIVHGRSCGETEITAVKSNEKSKCTVKVEKPEPIRSVYTNLPKKNENVRIYALTPKNADCVKFEISNSNFRKELYSSNKSENGASLLWQEEISPLSEGTYNLTAYSHIEGKWEKCHNSHIIFNILPLHTNSSEVSMNRKNLSREGISFIVACEGFVPRVYEDVVNILTIGCGKVIQPYKPFYNNLNELEGYQDFLNVVNELGYLSAVNDFLIENKVNFNQHHFDALVSFTYNLGKCWMKDNDIRNLMLEISNIPDYGITNSDNGLVVRAGPNKLSRRLGVLKNKEKVQVLSMDKKNHNWYHIKTSKNIVGYCYADFLNVFSGKKNGLNSINKSEFIKNFLQYHHAREKGKMKCFRGLLNRRIKELEVFFNGSYSQYVPINKYPIPVCYRNQYKTL